MVKLFRNISWDELAILFRDGKVEGEFNEEKVCTGYKAEYGNVVCCFMTPRNFDSNDGKVLIEINVPKERVIAEGFGTYDGDFQFEQEKYIEYKIKEVYIPYYELNEIKMYSKEEGETLYEQFRNERQFRLEFTVVKEENVDISTDTIGTFSNLYNNKDILKETFYYEGLIDLFENGYDIELEVYESIPMEELSMATN